MKARKSPIDPPKGKKSVNPQEKHSVLDDFNNPGRRLREQSKLPEWMFQKKDAAYYRRLNNHRLILEAKDRDLKRTSAAGIAESNARLAEIMKGKP